MKSAHWSKAFQSWEPCSVSLEQTQERLKHLVSSGRVHPLLPLAEASVLPSRERFENVGAALVEALRSLLPVAVRTELMRAVPELAEVMEWELRTGAGLGATRLDVVCPHEAPAEFQLLEVQAGDPSAMGYHDELALVFGQPPTLMASHRRAFEALTSGRRIAFLAAHGAIFESDHRLLAEHFGQNGWQARVVDPRDLRFDGHHLLALGEVVDAVFRDALDDLFVGDFLAGGLALISAVRSGSVALLNPFCAALGDDKSLLEPLSTPERWNSELAALLRAHVPCTRVLRERKVDWQGREVDLAQFLRTAQEHAVLKPIDGYGGIDVTVGAFCSSAHWDKALEIALQKPGSFIAQHYCPLPRTPVHFFQGREPEEAFVVHSLWFHPGLVGAFTRASVAPVVNVHLGASLAPVFFEPSFS